MKKRIFSLLLVLALLASVGMTAFAEADPVDAAQDPTATETTPPAEPASNEPAPVEPAAPAEIPAEPAGTPVESAPVPEADAATEADAAPEGEPAGDTPAPEPEAAPAANDGIATANNLALNLTANTNQITVQNAYNCWKAMVADHNAWKTKCPDGYITLTLAGVPDGAKVEWSVAPDQGGVGAGFDGSPGTTCVGIAAEEDGNHVLYLMGGSDISGCPAGHVYTITVSATVNGRTSNEQKVTFFCDRQVTPDPTETPNPGGDSGPESEIPEDMLDKSTTKDDYTKGVWLHVVNGSFAAKEYEKSASVWVQFQGEGTRVLPADLPEVTSTNGTLDGWYTEAPTEEMVTSGDGSYCYRQTTSFNGTKVPAGGVVPDGVQVLYAAFRYTEPVEGGPQLIEYYYDYNGMMGMYGHCLTRTGLKGQSIFDPESAAVYNFNFNKADFGQQELTWENLAAYWADGRTFEGYTFKGWSLDEKGGSIIDQNVTVENGMVFYAVWEKDDQNQTTFEKTDEDAGPLTHIRVISSLNDSRHSSPGESMTVSVFCTPVRAVPYNLTYTVTYTPSTGNIRDMLTGARTMKVTAEGIEYTDGKGEDDARGFEAVIVGNSLVVTKTDDRAVSMKVSVSATDKDGNVAVTNGGNPVLSFEHQISGKWTRTQNPTCTEPGVETAFCDGCKQDVTRKVYPLEHSWDFRQTEAPTCTATGLMEKVCTREGCDVKYGQWLADRGLTLTKGDQPKTVPATGHDYMNTGVVGVENGLRILKEECKTCHEEDEVVQGDLNGDGKISNLDIMKAYRYICKIDTEAHDEIACDVTGDGKLTNLDILKTYRYISKLITTME